MTSLSVCLVAKSEKHNLSYYVDEEGVLYKEKNNDGLIPCTLYQNKKGLYMVSQFGTTFKEMLAANDISGSILSSNVTKEWFVEQNAVVKEFCDVFTGYKIFVPELDQYFDNIDQLNQYIIDNSIKHMLSIYELKKTVTPKITVIL